MKEFFISYNKSDERWAMGLGDWLDQAGHTTVFQHQDFVPATNFAAEMHKALQNIERMIMVLSPDYLSAKFPLAEWTAAFATDPACESGTLIPVRVRECKPDGPLKPIVYIDLVGLNVNEARKRFLDGIASVLNRKRAPEPSKTLPADAKPKRSKFKQSVKGHHNTNIQAEHIAHLTIKTTSKKRLPKGHPPGTIGADMDMHNYVAYLVKRFNEFRRGAQKTYREKQPYPYSAIHTQIESVFGNPTYYLHQSRFYELVAFLKERINKTPAGLRNQKMGFRSYHTFEEHKSQSGGEG